MKDEMLNVYNDVSYYLNKVEENLRYASNSLREVLSVNDEGFKTRDINNYIEVINDAKYDVDNVIIPEIRNIGE